MATATYVRGEKRPVVYLAGADIAVDEIVILGVIDAKKSHVGVALEAIASGATGFVATAGVWNFPKVSAAVIKAGEALLWDASGSGVNDNAESSAAGDVAAFGMAMVDAGNGVTTLDVDISEAGTYDAA
jgi:predicted RecA/RadA family phage recombinase